MKFVAVFSLLVVLSKTTVDTNSCDPNELSFKFFRDKNCRDEKTSMSKLFGKVKATDFKYYSGKCEKKTRKTQSLQYKGEM